MTIQLLNQHLRELITVEEKIRKIQEVAELNGLRLPDEERLLLEIIKESLLKK